jgi:hypothetical protein
MLSSVNNFLGRSNGTEGGTFYFNNTTWVCHQAVEATSNNGRVDLIFDTSRQVPTGPENSPRTLAERW